MKNSAKSRARGSRQEESRLTKLGLAPTGGKNERSAKKITLFLVKWFKNGSVHRREFASYEAAMNFHVRLWRDGAKWACFPFVLKR